MKLSVESKVAAAVATAFVAVTLGSVVAQESSIDQAARPNQSSEILTLGVQSSVSQQGYHALGQRRE
jgi:hypothetical protein